MSGVAAPCRLADSVGAYVLAALPDDEARAFVGHLEHCRLCREDVTRLRAPLAQLAAGAPPATPPRTLRRSVMATVQREAADRRREDRTESPRRLSGLVGPRRATLAAAGAAAIVAAAVTVVIGAGSSHRVSVPAQSRSAGQVAVLTPGGAGQFVLTGQHGTLRVRGLPEPPHGRVYEVWVQRNGMAPEATDALFTTNQHGQADVGVPGSLVGVRRVLVTSEPRHGSVVPTRQPVIVVTL